MSEDRIKQFEEVLTMDPDDPVVRYGLAQILMDADRHPDAVPHLREAIRLQSDYSACYHLLGQCLEKTGDSEGAKAIYGQGIEMARGKGELHIVNLIEEQLRTLSG